MGKPRLYDFLKNGFSDNKQNKLDGYVLDKSLSNDTHQTYYNPKENKVVYNVRGTRPTSIGDWITDAKLFVGHGFKESDRYREAEKGLKEAKNKYKSASATVTGESLGGAIANYIAGSKDKVVTYNKAATFGSSLKHGDHHRTAGDIVSLLDMGKTHSHTLANKHTGDILKTLAKGATAIYTENPELGMEYIKETAGHVLQAHSAENIKDAPIFV